jgi:tRNA 2-thiocytidine biosynthesis protein TtcA
MLHSKLYGKPVLTTRALQKQQYSNNKLAKRLQRNVGQAIGDFNMIGEGDRVMVCLSGGKDSYTMLDILLELRKRAQLGIPFHIIEQDTYSVVRRVIPEGKTTCGLCSRLRRGALYKFASEHGITRIALGHHRDDIIETLFLNLFNGGRIKAMPPKLLSDDGAHVVIRPLAYCTEQDIARYAKERQFPIIPCNLCGSQPNLQRQAIKEMLALWKRKHPGRIENIFRAIGHVSPSQLADHELFDFRSLGTDSMPAQAQADWLRPLSEEDEPMQASG